MLSPNRRHFEKSNIEDILGFAKGKVNAVQQVLHLENANPSLAVREYMPKIREYFYSCLKLNELKLWNNIFF